LPFPSSAGNNCPPNTAAAIAPANIGTAASTPV
jgi:hypothetical protein